MSIVLNEREWAEAAIVSRQLGKKPMETLNRVSRYYYGEGYRKRDIRKKLGDFLLQCDPGAVLTKWSDTLDKLAGSAGRRPLIKLDCIDITEAELEVIGSLEGKQMKRLAFTLLCTAKYWNAVNRSNNGWINTADKDIMKMANINTSVRRQSAMLYDMKNAGLIRFGKRVDNLNIRVAYIRDDSPAELHISDFRNLGNQYLLYCGEAYFQCEQCGLTIKKKGNARKYCQDCAAEMYIKQSVESVMRQRKQPENQAV